MLTKGKMENALKQKGVRYADKQGCGTVGLAHLKTAQIIDLYFTYCVEEK